MFKNQATHQNWNDCTGFHKPHSAYDNFPPMQLGCEVCWVPCGSDTGAWSLASSHRVMHLCLIVWVRLLHPLQISEARNHKTTPISTHWWRFSSFELGRLWLMCPKLMLEWAGSTSVEAAIWHLDIAVNTQSELCRIWVYPVQLLCLSTAPCQYHTLWMTSMRMEVGDQPGVGHQATRISRGYGQSSWVWRSKWCQEETFQNCLAAVQQSQIMSVKSSLFTRWLSTGASFNPTNRCTNWAREALNEPKYGEKQDSNGYIHPNLHHWLIDDAHAYLIYMGDLCEHM